jgi:hypothetical protein
MSTLNINELYETMYSKNINRLQKFDGILKCIHNKIKYNAKQERTSCFYQIPEFIIGVPLYNINDLRKYIISSLESNGFKLLYFDPNIVFITWEIKINKKKEKLNQKKQKQQTNDFKLIDEYKPQGDLIYNSLDLLSMKDKSKELLK